MIESMIGLKINNTFSAGSTFTFSSWTFMVAYPSMLQGRPMDTSVDQAPPAPRHDALEDLTEKLSEFLISSPTRTQKHLK
jgi:hypothetical protein